MKKTLISEFDLVDIEFESVEPTEAELQKAPEHYVDNKELQREFVIYYEKKKKWLAEGKPGVPPLSHKIGAAILQIANRRTYSWNFISYTQHWKEEMIGDAVETCVRYAHNYNPEKYNNPFAYITQLVTNALKQRIKTEKKKLYVKYKLFDNANGFQAFADEEHDEDVSEGIKEMSDAYSGYLEFIHEFEQKHFAKDETEDPIDDSCISLTEFIDK
jgi:hypothetical protein